MAKCIIAALQLGASFAGIPQYLKAAFHLAPVVQRVDSTIQWINLCPVDGAIIGFPNTYPLDSYLSGG